MKEIIGQFDNKIISRHYHLEEELVHFVESVTWGVGDTQYEHFYALHRLHHIPDPVYFTAREAGTHELLGAVVFGRRYILGIKAYYIRFFAVSPKIRGQGLTTQLAVFLFDFLRAEEKDPVIFYASTDRTNPSVNRMAGRIGFEELALNRTLAFSRFRPQKKAEASPLSDAEFAEFLPQLEQFYAGHGFWTADNVGKDGHYFVLRENGRIIAGLQAYKGFWRIGKLPGFLGKLLLGVIPYTPLRIIFNPKSFHFLAFEGIYFAPGCEHRLQDLMETVLHHFQYHTALFWMTTTDPLGARIEQRNSMGLLNSFLRHTMARFIASFQQVEEDVERELRTRPIYNSSLDYI
jgi:RimJ/RimL family protein N-acetyltransferase